MVSSFRENQRFIKVDFTISFSWKWVRTIASIVFWRVNQDAYVLMAILFISFTVFIILFIYFLVVFIHCHHSRRGLWMVCGMTSSLQTSRQCIFGIISKASSTKGFMSMLRFICGSTKINKHSTFSNSSFICCVLELCISRSVGAMDSALDFESRGCEFESHTDRNTFSSSVIVLMLLATILYYKYAFNRTHLLFFI